MKKVKEKGKDEIEQGRMSAKYEKLLITNSYIVIFALISFLALSHPCLVPLLFHLRSLHPNSFCKCFYSIILQLQQLCCALSQCVCVLLDSVALDRLEPLSYSINVASGSDHTLVLQRCYISTCTYN